jgi:hypothetical protein
MTAPTSPLPGGPRKPSAQARRHRGPAMGYTALMIGLVVVFTAMLLTAPQTQRPAIAEIAPQAVAQIKDAPQEQASTNGSGADVGGTGLGGQSPESATTTTAPPPNPSATGSGAPDLKSIKRCVGNPPRQTEDPQSPPCVPYWDPSRDNGGATSFGVTREDITIAVPDYVQPVHDALANYFNARFEFYGRKLVLKPVTQGTDGTQGGEEQAAIEAHDSLRAFASTDNPYGGGFWYAQYLADRKIIYSAMRPLSAESYLTRFRPYVWQYPMSADRIFANIGEWLCNRLAGQNAVHAGGTDAQGRPLQAERRKFGLVVERDYDENPLNPGALTQELDACGNHVAQEIDWNAGEGRNPATATDAVLKMQQAGVTSIICLCIHNATEELGSGASGQGYFPEWLLSSYYLLDNNYLTGHEPTSGLPPDEREHVMGLAFVPREWNLPSHMSYQAGREGGPTTFGVDDNSGQAYVLDNAYRSLLLIASGIQMAGPHLTPETFEQGLQHASFPNPAHELVAGRVGFGGGLHTMTLDAAEWFYSNSAQSPYLRDGAGAMCYVDHGARHTSGNWPKGGDPFYNQPCDTGGQGPDPNRTG